MKKLYLSFLASVFSFCAYSQSLEAYPTSQRYLFNPYNRDSVYIDSVQHYSDVFHVDAAFSYGIAGYMVNYNEYQMYPVKNDTSFQVYGVAIPMEIVIEDYPRGNNKSGCYGYYWESDDLSPYDESVRDLYWQTFVDSLHVLWSHWDASTLHGCGMRVIDEKYIYLIQKTDEPQHPIIVTDSVKIRYGVNATGWNRLQKPKLYDIEETNIWHEGGYIVPTLEVFFDHPLSVVDTFFVGCTSIGKKYNEEMWNAYAVSAKTIPLCRISYMSDRSRSSHGFNGVFRTDGVDFVLYRGDQLDHWTTVQYPGSIQYDLQDVWGGPMAIVAPPPCMPAHNVRMTQVGYDSAAVEWEMPIGVSHCRLEYGRQGFASGSGVVADSLTEGYFRLPNLEENTDYEVRVSCWCTYEEAYSEAVSVVFRTEYRCPPIQGLASIGVDDSTIAMVWQMADSADYSEVEYGAVGFAEGEGTLVTNITRNYGGYGYVMISGLTPGTAYEIRMRNYCGHSDPVSQWFCIDTVTTGGNPMVESIDEGWRGAVTLSPNPATTRFSLESPVAIARVVVTDLSGRIVYDKRMNSNTATIATEGWPKGLVLVAIETERGVLLRKLMIK